jgi:hypothetical protein
MVTRADARAEGSEHPARATGSGQIPCSHRKRRRSHRSHRSRARRRAMPPSGGGAQRGSRCSHTERTGGEQTKLWRHEAPHGDPYASRE